jgi:membrane-bound lytic murein transglycosylase B
MPQPFFYSYLYGVVLAVASSSANSRPVVSSPQEPPDIVTYGQREDVMRFATELSERQQLDATWVKNQLAQSRYLPTVARLIMPPPQGSVKNWAAYRARFVEPVRLRAGVAFWRENQATLAKAQEVYGVPAEVVVGVIGVETIYGRQMGTFKVIDALATLSFDFPKGRKDRTDFFRDELEQLLVLSQRMGRDANDFQGSYAGAWAWASSCPVAGINMQLILMAMAKLICKIALPMSSAAWPIIWQNLAGNGACPYALM